MRIGRSSVALAGAAALALIGLNGCGEKGAASTPTAAAAGSSGGAGRTGGAQGSGGGAGAAGGGGGQRGGAPSRKFPVRTAPVETRPVTYEISAVGNLVEENRYQIPARVSGVAELVKFAEGDRVTTGQELCRVDFDRYQLLAERARNQVKEAEASVTRAEAGLADAMRETSSALETSRIDMDLAESEFRRRQNLQSSAITAEDRRQFEVKYQRAQTMWRDAQLSVRTRVAVAQATLSEQRTALASAKAALAIAENDLRDAVVKAPMAGVVQSRAVTEGQYLTPGYVVALMVQTDPLRLSFTVPESKSSKLSTSMKARFTVPAHPNRTFEADVYQVGNIADPQTREVTCWARVPNAAGELRPGYFSSVRLEAEQKNASIVVPLASVLATEYGTVAYVVKDMIAQRRRVQTGLQVTGDSVEVLSGLQPGEQLVVEGMESLLDGVPVEIRTTGTPGGGGDGGGSKQGKAAKTAAAEPAAAGASETNMAQSTPRNSPNNPPAAPGHEVSTTATRTTS